MTRTNDELNPEYRSRLVGRKFNQARTIRSTRVHPPTFEVSWAATVKKHRIGHAHELIINNIRRACFYAKASRDQFVEAPDQDPRKRPGLVGRLKLCLYGTRDAAKLRQQTLTEHVIEIGFKQGRGHIRVFHHPERNIRTPIDGDDYCSAGARARTWIGCRLSWRKLTS